MLFAPPWVNAYCVPVESTEKEAHCVSFTWVPTGVAVKLYDGAAAALGAQAGEQRLREVVTSGGFTRIRRATETPLNMVLEARV